MALFNMNRERPDYDRYRPKHTGIMLVLTTVWRELISLITLNFIFDLFLLPAVGIFFAWGLLNDFMTFFLVALALLVLMILTLPAAVTAMSRITVTMVRDENFFLWPDFWKSWKKNFGRSLAGGLIFGLALGLFILAAFVYYNIFGSQSFLMVIIGALLACLILITLTASFYFWPMLAYVDLPLKALLKNSLILVLGCWKRSLLALLTVLIFVLIIGFWPWDGYDFLLLLALMIGIALFSLCQSFALYPAIYDKVIRREEEEEELTPGLKSGELNWEEPEELQSASLKDLDFGPEE